MSLHTYHRNISKHTSMLIYILNYSPRIFFWNTNFWKAVAWRSLAVWFIAVCLPIKDLEIQISKLNCDYPNWQLNKFMRMIISIDRRKYFSFASGATSNCFQNLFRNFNLIDGLVKTRFPLTCLGLHGTHIYCEIMAPTTSQMNKYFSW